MSSERIAKRFRRYVRGIVNPNERDAQLRRIVESDAGRRSHRERGRMRVRLHRAYLAHLRGAP